MDSTEPNLGSSPNEAVAEPLSEETIDEKKLLRKLDWHIIPPLSLLYLLCYLDRTYSPPPTTLSLGISAMLGFKFCFRANNHQIIQP